jgi:membrane protein implicated in regulation of membrane protease activity
MRSPRILFSLGLILMLLGVVLPFMMVVHLIESTFFLNFFSWAASVIGLALGMISVAFMVKPHK